MARGLSHPLRALRELRDRELQRAERILAGRLTELEAARALRGELERELARRLDVQRSRRELEATLALQGGRCAGQLVAAHLHLEVLAGAVAEQRRAVEAQRSAVTACTEALETARLELREAHRAVELLARHEARLRAAWRKREEAALEEAADDAAQAIGLRLREDRS